MFEDCNCIFPLALIGSLGLLYFFFIKKTKACIKGKHVLLTGGSSGIGLEIAMDVVKKGANVTVIARNPSKLSIAKGLIETQSTEGARVQTFSMDVAAKKEEISKIVSAAEESFGPVYMLINCAGVCMPTRFEDQAYEDVKAMMDVNFFGPFFITQEVVRRMKRQEVEGIIVFVSSAAGFVGLYGYSAYSAAKGAVIRFAEALHMELKPYKISVTVSVPPDTDTPGFQEENKMKPVETKLISDSGGLFTAEKVATKTVDDSLSREFLSTVGLSANIMRVLCVGMGPVTNYFHLLVEILLMGLFRLVAAIFLWDFGRIIRRETDKRQSGKKCE